MNEQELELLELHKRAQEHLNSLVISGVEDRVATIATMVACMERMVAAGGNAATSHFLRSMAVKIDKGEMQSA